MYEFNFILWKIQYIQVYYTAHIQVHSTFIRIHSRERLSGASYSLQPCHFSTSPTHDSLSYLWLSHIHGTTICNWSVLLKMSLVPHQSGNSLQPAGTCCNWGVLPHHLQRAGCSLSRKIPTLGPDKGGPCVFYTYEDKNQRNTISMIWEMQFTERKIYKFIEKIWKHNLARTWPVQHVAGATGTYMCVWRTKQAPEFGRVTCCSNASKMPFLKSRFSLSPVIFMYPNVHWLWEGCKQIPKFGILASIDYE